MEAYGYPGLFLSAFLAATIVPFSSEALLYALIQSGVYSSWGLWLCATAGNVGGAAVNWGLGRFLMRFQERKWFPFTLKDIERASSAYQRFGVWTLLFAWVPVIGDPLTLIAGLFRTPPLIFLILVTIGKGGRYAVVVWLS